jgi:release factor glutamine methyltransferase
MAQQKVEDTGVYKELLYRLQEQLQVLPDKHEEAPEETLRGLWHAAAGIPLSIVAAQTYPLEELSEDQLFRLYGLVEQRLSGTPFEHLTGLQHFMGLDFYVCPHVLTPRKETEILGYSALQIIRDIAQTQGLVKVIDVCTGSGNLAHSFAHHEPRSTVHASDLSFRSICCAGRNTEKHGLDDRVSLRMGDLLIPFEEESFIRNIDVITCNPPYISSGKIKKMPSEIVNNEPLLAFDGGPFGIRILFRLAEEALHLLKPGGWLCFEVGEGQGYRMKERLEKMKAFSEIQTVNNDSGSIRAILARSRKTANAK